MTVKSLAQVKDTVIELLPETFGPLERQVMKKAGVMGTGRPAMVNEITKGHLIPVARVAEDVYGGTETPSIVTPWAGIAFEIRYFQACTAEERGDYYSAYFDYLAAANAKLKLVGIQKGSTKRNKKLRLYEEAYPHLAKSVECMEKLIESGSGDRMEYTHRSCHTNSRAGSVAMKIEHYEPAYNHFRKSVEQAKTLSEELPEPERLEYRRIVAHQNSFAGDALMKLRRFEEAYGTYREAIDQTSELSKTASPSERAEYRSYICYQTGFIADAAAGMERYDEAFRLYNRSALLAQNLSGESKGEQKIKYIRQACYMHNRAGKSADRMLDKPDLPDSERNLWRVHHTESYERAHRILDNLGDSLSRSKEIEKLRVMVGYDPESSSRQMDGTVLAKNRVKNK